MPRIPPELANRQSPAEDDHLNRLGQISNISEIEKIGTGEWTVLYEFHSDQAGTRCSYAGLLLPGEAAKALKNTSWDLRIGSGGPSFSVSHRGNEEIIEYDRFGFKGGEPIVHSRDFHGIKPSQFDLSEEFRLFHNLYHDRSNDRYIHIDDRGNETVVAEVSQKQVRVLTRFLRRYMAARQLNLALFFDLVTRGEVDVEKARVAFPAKTVITSDRNYSFNIGDGMGETFSRLVGKKIVFAPPIEQSGVWPYETDEEAKYADFAIGTGEDGQPILHNSNPDNLANYFGANEHAPHYLTPVWFKRDVLVKYYNDPIRFSVEDGYLRCGSLWGLRIDNNSADHVVVYLGDLGRDLDYEEQVYWKHFNVTPGGRQPSETNFRRAFLAEFTDPSAPDLRFKQDYTELNEVWTKRFGWPIFRQLHEGDAHTLRQLHIPITEAFGEFDVQVLFLVKLLIDSLNEAELTKACGGGPVDEKGISKFRRFLQNQEYPETDRDIGLLRTLQELRSSGAAHAKGKNFDKVRKRIGLDIESPKDVFRVLISQANRMLADLSDFVSAE